MRSQAEFALAHPVYDPPRDMVPDHWFIAGDGLSACLTVNIGME